MLSRPVPSFCVALVARELYRRRQGTPPFIVALSHSLRAGRLLALSKVHLSEQKYNLGRLECPRVLTHTNKIPKHCNPTYRQFRQELDRPGEFYQTLASRHYRPVGPASFRTKLSWQ
ncbi:hypothetical protein [Echinococcus multilocularis]|uniref:Uncharacterized protein n=1 Tax=Echinococcus multilocularis TaxID=6211 RepID=A0A0S4MME0_ECHMU|nr:hypothetical protein [Echinococcus multilocularis]